MTTSGQGSSFHCLNSPFSTLVVVVTVSSFCPVSTATDTHKGFQNQSNFFPQEAMFFLSYCLFITPQYYVQPHKQMALKKIAVGLLVSINNTVHVMYYIYSLNILPLPKQTELGFNPAAQTGSFNPQCFHKYWAKSFI